MRYSKDELKAPGCITKVMEDSRSRRQRLTPCSSDPSSNCCHWLLLLPELLLPVPLLPELLLSVPLLSALFIKLLRAVLNPELSQTPC